MLGHICGHLSFAGIGVGLVLDLGDHHDLLLLPLAVLARVAGVDHLLDQQHHHGVHITLTLKVGIVEYFRAVT